MSTRIRWPTSKRLLVGGSAIVTGHGHARLEQHLPVEALAVAAADHGVVEEHVEPVRVVLVRRVHVDQLRREVGVERARRDPQVHGRSARSPRPARASGSVWKTSTSGRSREPRVRLLGAEERGRLRLVGRPRREQVAQPQHRVEEARPGLLHARALGRQLADRAVEAADRRHRVGRVEREAPRRGVRRRRLVGRERAVGVQVVRRLDARARAATPAPRASGRRGRACPPASSGPSRRP